MTPKLPLSHPLASAKGQWKFLWSMAWRWLVASASGALLNSLIISVLIGFILFHLWLRAHRSEEFYKPYAEPKKIGRAHAAIWRLGSLSLCVGGLWASYHSSDGSMIAAWSGIVLAMFVESFFILKFLSGQES
ncbi:hypothetical protein [Sphingopyxis sp.]|uniref:hypothetical protein n=1 Tax=Sphingopyxis sp. TaxID=1908224 RepID=UPI002D77AAF4|nr:hypothetical protein [Sphingopyxis sp.]HET6526304.1 hypothetical protein [Sphingopyxis sp.]